MVAKRQGEPRVKNQTTAERKSDRELVVRRTFEAPEFPGSHTTPSGRSAYSTGSVIEPCSFLTVAVPFTPKRSAVAALSRMTAGRCDLERVSDVLAFILCALVAMSTLKLR